VGGSGKTILVQALIEYFVKHNKVPAVLSRGYGRSTKGLFLVADKTSLRGSVASSGDEPYLIATKHTGVPIVVAEDRVVGATYLIETFRPDVIILDDGFQHRRLHRGLDLVILDQAKGPGNHHLPWGRLREPQSALNRATLVLYSKAGLQDDLSQNLILELDDYLTNYAGEHNPLPGLNGEYGLFAGLGNPTHFFTSMEALLGPSRTRIPLPDHVHYTRATLERITHEPCKLWITTEKDFIKLDPAFCQQYNIHSIGVSTPLPPALLGLLNQTFNL